MRGLGIPDAELEILKALNRGDVAYLLIGGYAMRWYGATRQTIDVDLLASSTLDNARRFVRALERALGHVPGFSAEMFAEAKKQVRFQGDGYRMSVLTSVEGLAFEAAYGEREHAPQGHVVIPVVSRRHLAFIKRVAANADLGRRNKEMGDIAFLEAQGTA
ncbi:MAG TPA: nucleotidyl transferase AbiEii/AbiGii toxin family protein [Nitrospiria bacterium]|jgi:hypothetical protein